MAGITKSTVPGTNGKTEPKLHAPKKLDIACGQNKQAGFKGIDIRGDADIVHDLNVFPWPIKTSSVKEAFCSHYVEHIPHWRPGWERDGWWLFFDELHRIMAKDATIQIHHPYVKNDRAFWDPTHDRYIHEVTWYYLSKQWREMQGLDHYDVSLRLRGRHDQHRPAGRPRLTLAGGAGLPAQPLLERGR